MHETALAKRILDEVLARAEGRRVRRVTGAIAEDEALSADSLSFHFAAHARGTPAETAELALELHHVSARCRACGRTFLPEHHVRLCPHCGSRETELEGETGVRVESIVVDE
jgi:hydrogenase nickel incorporation protein HypA/HybF